MRIGAHDVAATRSAYDAVAAEYARRVPDLTVETPLDRAVLAAFAEMLVDHLGGLVAEVGCGTGRVTQHLHDAGVRMIGFDLSPGMVAIARASHGTLPFAAAHAAALPLQAGALGGLVAWYSLIHLPTSALGEVFAEFARVTRPGAPVVVAFQSGDGQEVERATSYGRSVPLRYYRHRAEDVTAALTQAGFERYATVDREGVLAFETTPQAIVLAQRGEWR